MEKTIERSKSRPLDYGETSPLSKVMHLLATVILLLISRRYCQDCLHIQGVSHLSALPKLKEDDGLRGDVPW